MGRERAIVAAALWLVAASICDPAMAAPVLESFAGVVGGAPNGTNIPGSCSTYPAPAVFQSFFGGGLGFFVPQGGIADCGYSGDLSDLTAAVGPLVATQSLAPVILGNPGFAGTFTGSADATADYKTLGASAHGTVTSPGAGTTLALQASASAALFDDILTVSSPLVTSPSPGFVRYVFGFHGDLAVPTVVVSGLGGTASAQLHIAHAGGGTLRIVGVDVGAGGTGVLNSRDGTNAGFVAGVGSIAGAGTFTSAVQDGLGNTYDLPIVWGQPFELKAGLLALVFGNGNSNFSTTAVLTDVQFFDAAHNPVTTFSVTSASGTFYGNCAADSDGDGTLDCVDGCPSDAAKTAAGICGCGVSDADGDGDGTADCVDACPSDAAKTAAGICGCGVSDADSDGDGTADCQDGCPGDAGKLAPGACGCGLADTDTDDDGTPDCQDFGQDLAVTSIATPKIVTLTAKKPSIITKVSVQIQNRRPTSEVIPDLATLSSLVELQLTPLGAVCAAPAAVLAAPSKFPITLRSKAKLKISFEVTFACANDPVKSSRKDPGHDDFVATAQVMRSALSDGLPDTHAQDDVCPRDVTPPFVLDPNPDGSIKDQGCGAKKADKTLGGPVMIDVVVK